MVNLSKYGVVQHIEDNISKVVKKGVNIRFVVIAVDPGQKLPGLTEINYEGKLYNCLFTVQRRGATVFWV